MSIPSVNQSHSDSAIGVRNKTKHSLKIQPNFAMMLTLLRFYSPSYYATVYYLHLLFFFFFFFRK